MKIGQVAPLFESVPPKLYGGTERVVSYLTEELVRQGHEVTLFASGDSVTKAELVAGAPRALRLDQECIDRMSHQIVQLQQVADQSKDFDIIHYHTDYIHFPLTRQMKTSTVTTLHGRLDIPDLIPLYRRFPDMPLVSISNSQRAPLPWVNWQATVYHGLPEDLYKPRYKKGDYLAFLGRISPEKRADRAIEIARRVGMKIKIAAKVDAADKEFFEAVIKPLLSQPHVEFIGEIGERDKGEFLGDAHALLFPIDWCEPFGLVMIESMACGTPVVAYKCGSVPEVMDDGVTGFVVNSLEEATGAVEKIERLDRRKCRGRFEERFSARRMAQDYVKLFEGIISKNDPAEAVDRRAAQIENVASGAGRTHGRHHSGQGSVLRPSYLLPG